MRGKKAKLARRITANAMKDPTVKNANAAMYNFRQIRFKRSSGTGNIPFTTGPIRMAYQNCKKYIQGRG